MSSRIRRLKGELGASRVGAENLSAAMAVMIRKGCGEAQSPPSARVSSAPGIDGGKSCTLPARDVNCAHQARFQASADSLVFCTGTHRVLARRHPACRPLAHRTFARGT